MRRSSKRRAPGRAVVFLGPQRLAPTVREALTPLAPGDGPVAVVTAGWEERELEHDELSAHLERDVINLELFHRMEDVLQQDPELRDVLIARLNTMRGLQRLYRVRLRHTARAVEDLMTREDPEDLIEAARTAAFTSLQHLDEQHLERTATIQREIETSLDLDSRPALTVHREEIAAELAESDALCIAGGHVRRLLTGLWLFDVLGLLPATTPILAWSAGTMALTDRVVLFHDRPPQGPGWAEILSPGLGICPGLVALPNAGRRLRLDDAVRVQLLSRRFPDAICAALDPRTKLTFQDGVWSAGEPTMRLTVEGTIAPLSALGTR